MSITIAEQVAEGVKFLDEVRPGWRELVNVETLDISDPWNCVLGQVFADKADLDSNARNGYVWAYREFQRSEEDFAWTSDLGFAGGSRLRMSFCEELRELTEAWKAELQPQPQLLTIRRHEAGLGHICCSTNAELLDAAGKIVGYVKPEIADRLVRHGLALDIVE